MRRDLAALLSLLILCREMMDWDRFKNRRHVGSFTGLVPSEGSTGLSRRLGSVTKVGNPTVRAILVEMAWAQRRAKIDQQLAAAITMMANSIRAGLTLVQALQRLGGQGLVIAGAPVVAVQEVGRQHRDVLRALPQRRDPQRHHVEAVEEVLAEDALAHALRQVAVGRRQDAHVDLLRPRRADATRLSDWATCAQEPEGVQSHHPFRQALR